MNLINFVKNKIFHSRKDKWYWLKQELAFEITKNFNDPTLINIHWIKISKFFGKITIKLYLERPGLFIGKHGETINKIKTNLNAYLRFKKINCEVKFKLYSYMPLQIAYFMKY
jgi:ribosomal protein S3